LNNFSVGYFIDTFWIWQKDRQYIFGAWGINLIDEKIVKILTKCHTFDRTLQSLC
jgi:hypothetical protein